jgi:hypothetical protein
MKSSRKFLAAFLAACFFTVAAFAADASPAGLWKWKQPGQDGQSFDRQLKLDLKDGKLTGAILAGESMMGPLPEVAIKDATFKDGVVAFSITRDIQGQSFTVKYSGKLDGDAIKGTSEFPGFGGGEPTKREWEAKRDK